MIQAISLFLALILMIPAGAFAAPASENCAPRKEMTMQESDAFLMFNARLSHLLYHYGKPSLETKLQEIITNQWPKVKMIQVSPIFFERVQNLVDQARLKDTVARTIGLEHKSWINFESQMRTITLLNSTGGDLLNPLDKAGLNLLKSIGEMEAPKDSALSAQEWNTLKAEAIARSTTMYMYMLRWKALNGEIIDEVAQAHGKVMAVAAIGLVGGAVLCSTLVVSAPIVSGAGVTAAGLSTNPVVTAMLAKIAEAAAGSVIGLFGAPAAQTLQDSYLTITDAKKNSLNNQSSYSCELSKRIGQWKSEAGEKTVSAALTGAGMGAAGGLLTFTGAGSKVVLYATGIGVGVAQLYALGKMSESTIESLAYYKLAEDAEASGDHDLALKHLFHARDLAQEAGEKALESIIIGTLSYHVSHNFKHALHKGESAIRQLYAASADTIPTAAQAARNMVRSASRMLISETSADH